jgi:hypothetical protein
MRQLGWHDDLDLGFIEIDDPRSRLEKAPVAA